jgi:hypothetical protein
MKPTDREPPGAPPLPHGHAEHDILDNEDVAHEHSDVNIRTLLMLSAGLAVVVIGVVVLMYGVFIVFERQAAANDPVLSPLALPGGRLPPEPRLLTNEPLHLQQVLEENRERLEPRTADAALLQEGRLGIEAAKKQLVERGLPVRGTAVEPWVGTNAPVRGEASGGRVLPVTSTTTGQQQPTEPPAGQPATAGGAAKPGGGGH